MYFTVLLYIFYCVFCVFNSVVPCISLCCYMYLIVFSVYLIVLFYVYFTVLLYVFNCVFCVFNCVILCITPRKYSWHSFLLDAVSTPGPQCGRWDYVNEKFQLG
jgi:hypothetical protein